MVSAWKGSMSSLVRTASKGLTWAQARGQEAERALLLPLARASHREGQLSARGTRLFAGGTEGKVSLGDNF